RRGPATAVRQPESSSAPGLDAGARRQYIAEPSKDGGKTTVGERRTKPVLRGSPGRRDRAAIGTGRGDTAAYMHERERAAELARGGCGGERKQWHGQSTAAPVPSAWPLWGRSGQARRRRCSSVLPS